MLHKELYDIAAQMAGDAYRDVCSYPRCFVSEATPADNVGDFWSTAFYWSEVTTVWPDGFCDPS